MGIEKQNGTKVLAHFLPEFPIDTRSEIAHVVAKLIPRWPLTVFDANDIFNVLKWAHRGFDAQKNSLIDQLLERLNKVDLRESTFESLLDNADIIEDHGFSSKVQAWLSSILSVEMQTQPTVLDNDQTVSAANNMEFAEWVIRLIDQYEENVLVIEKYFSDSLTEYMFNRILGEYGETPAVILGAEGLGSAIGLNPKNRTRNKNTSRIINIGGVFVWPEKKEVKTIR